MELLKYYENKLLNFSINKHEFVTIMGSGNKKIVDNLLFKEKNEFITINGEKVNAKNLMKYRNEVSLVVNAHLNTFTSETVEDELAFCMENLCIKTSVMHERILAASVKFELEDILHADPETIGSSKKAVIKIISSIFYGPKVLILDNILCELDKKDKERVLEYLVHYVKEGNAVINFTADIEDTLYGNHIILVDEEKVIASGKTLAILKEEKLMNRLGFSLPFLMDLNKQLMYYDIIDKYTLDEEGLVDDIWK